MDFMSGRQFVSLGELRELCPDVTSMTLHRDLDAFERDGVIIKMRGGARVTSQPVDTSFLSRETENIAAKQIIAAKAAGLVREGGSIFFDAGTTTLAVIRALPDINLTVVTNGANFAYEMQRFSNVTVYMCCGALNRSNMALSGQSTLDFLDGINIDLGFIGVSGYSEECGFTCGKESEMFVKRHVIRKARKSVAVMDLTKFTRLLPHTFARLNDFDAVISDGVTPDNFLREAAEAGVTVL